MIRYLYLAGCLLINLALRAQTPVASFTSSAPTGCGPLGVNFTNQSTGNPKFWNWEFSGDAGQNGQLSTLQNPAITFYTPGRYTVKLVVRNADGTNGITKTGYINVLPFPSANFVADKTEACLPATIGFQDLSTSTSGTINSWQWAFGDGGSSTQRNPVHTYNDNGFYSVSLKVTSTSGCSGETTFGRYIRIVSGVKAAFDPSVDGACVAPFNATFSNQTSGPGTLSYIWRFPDGTTSTDVNPVKLYNAPGTYNVKLVASSNLGCSDSIQAPLTINATNVQFTLPPGACINTPLTFTNNSATGAISTLWDFGDGTTSNQTSPVKTYSNPGTYTVSLTAAYNNCSSTVSQQLVVTGPPSVDFTADKTAACKAPLSVNFAANAPGAVKWAWDFGDGSTASTANPTHNYSNTGEYNVSLTITNANNCTNTIVKNAFIKITPPNITMPNVAEACVNSLYQPAANNNIAVTSPDPIATYTWNWGDNTPDGTGMNASHAYTSENEYTVTLTVVTAGGCSVTAAFPSAVLVGDLITANFTADKLQVCDKAPVQFNNTSAVNAVSPAGDTFLWTFSDGGTSTDENPMHNFSGKGKYSVTLKVRNKGCYDTKTITDYIEVIPPTARFSFKLVNCNDPYTYNFVSTSDTSAPPATSTYTWEFNGGIGSTTDANTTITFPALGTYPVTLTVTDANRCSSTTVPENVPVFIESATLSSAKSTLCKNETVRLTATVAQPQNIAAYEWRINGGAPILKTTASWDTSFAATGTYTLTATLTDINGCFVRQNAPIAILVQGPMAKFDVPVNKGCKNSIIAFTDQSTAAAGIKSWEWSFGDAGTSSAQNPSHTYTDTGQFTVKLILTDNNGCPDIVEYIDTVKIRQPIAAFKAANTLFCHNSNLQFTDTSKGYGLTYLWNFGDGKTSTDQNPVQVYSGADNKYTVTLQIKDDAGCTDQVTKTDYIEIKSPKPAFTVSDSISLCRLFETKFTFAGKDFESFSWNFGDDATSSAKDPTHFYNEFGNYTAKLYLKGYGGCLDSAEHSIQLIPASSSMISYTAPPFQCNELNVDFTLIPPPGMAYQFYFGDGASDASKSLNISHLYKSLGTFGPQMLMTDKQGCQSTASGATAVKIIGALPFYGQDRKAFCNSGDVVFTEYIQKNDPVTSYTWNFGDGNSVSDQNVIYTYNTPGTYITSLTVTTVNCPGNTYYDTVRVYRTPDPSIISNDFVCISDSISLNGILAVADTSITWKWNLGNNSTATGENLTVKYNDTGSYKITLEASNLLGCKLPVPASKSISVKPLPEIRILTNPVIPVRTDITLPVTYSSNVVTYNWTPAKDLSCTDCATPVANPQFTTKYSIAVVDEFGCKSSKDITVNVICNELNYFVPNTFSPNGDGNNEVFYPRGKGLYNIVSLRIFNRWGEQVFEKRNFPSNDPSAGWNGTYKGKPAPAEVYVYIMEVVCDNAQIIALKGNVTLLR